MTELLTPAVIDADNVVQGVRTKTVKKSARAIIEKYYSRLTMDFHTNKRVCDEVAIIPSKRMRNKIAGFVTHLMKRIQRGPVRGISLKLQEEERERRMDFVPEVYRARGLLHYFVCIALCCPIGYWAVAANSSQLDAAFTDNEQVGVVYTRLLLRCSGIELLGCHTTMGHANMMS